jgi:hypothetical protein
MRRPEHWRGERATSTISGSWLPATRWLGASIQSEYTMLMFSRLVRPAHAFAGMALVALGSVVAPAQEHPIQGGPGGTPFRQQCGEQEYLVGFEARGASWVDAVRVLCAPWVRNTRTLGPAVAPSGFAGGSGGTLRAVRCPSGAQAVSTISFYLTGSRGTLSVDDARLVTGFYFACGNLNPPHQRSPQNHEILSASHFLASAPSGPFTTGRDVEMLSPQSCPAGTLATGLHGRAGEYVDALGLICGAAPTPVAAMGQSTRTTGRNLSKERVGGRVSTQPRAPQTAGGAAKVGGAGKPSTKGGSSAGSSPPGEPSTPAVPPPAASEPVRAVFQNPTTPAGQRLNVCLQLPNRQCGEPAAKQFCEARGHAAAVAFSTEVLKGESHTWSGTQCRSAQCEAFTSITCQAR